MYFWNIEKLKTQLIERPLTDKETLPYLMLTMAFIPMGFMSQPAQPNMWDYVLLFINVVSGIAGAYWLYLKNNADAGNHFLQRYFTVGWVAGIRFIVFLIPVFIVLTGILFFTKSEPIFGEFMGFGGVLLSSALMLTFYWYLGKHIADVAEKAKY